MRSISGVREWILSLLLFFYGSMLFAQESLKEQEKKNPEARNLEIGIPQQDSSRSKQQAEQRLLPKFDVPEYVITGISSIDLPTVDKISLQEDLSEPQKAMKSYGKNQRDRETMELEIMRLDNSQYNLNAYSGMVKGGIGSFFTPQVEVWFGQSPQNFRYSLGGAYRLTKGFKNYTDQSEGSFTVSGSTSLLSDVSMFQNSTVDAAVDYSSESFRFYGSTTPSLQRTISDLNLKVGIENQTLNIFPYLARISFRNSNIADHIADSSVSTGETCMDVNIQTTMPVSLFPVQLKFHGMIASSGLGFMDVSGGVQNYQFAGILLSGSLHVYWAKGMAGQNFFRLRPHLRASYSFTSQHRIYVAYEPMLVPVTLASNIRANRFLSADSKVKHADVANAGELGLESDWNETICSRVSFGVKSIRDLTMFLDSARQGVWMTAYGGQATIVTFRAEMVAKFKSNDYFASNITLRSTKDSFLNKRIPYFPEIEAGFRISHGFGTAIAIHVDAKFVGDRKFEFFGDSTLSSYAVIDLSGDYTPLDFLRLSIGIKNLTNARYEMWRGYQEFPLTIQFSAQVKW